MYCKVCGEPLNENQAICLKCGVEVGKGKGFCYNCGNPVHEEAVFCVNCGVSLKTENRQPATNSNLFGIAPKDLVKAIILSLVTCGIYGIIWFVSLTNEMNKASGRVNDTNGGTAFLLTLVTCGIYGYFWAYKLGEKRDIVANEKTSANLLYIVLMVLGLGIVVYALAQDALNKAIENNR